MGSGRTLGSKSDRIMAISDQSHRDCALSFRFLSALPCVPCNDSQLARMHIADPPHYVVSSATHKCTVPVRVGSILVTLSSTRVCIRNPDSRFESRMVVIVFIPYRSPHGELYSILNSRFSIHWTWPTLTVESLLLVALFSVECQLSPSAPRLLRVQK